MDLETENRIAAILLKEAAESRRQAQREGALAYLRQPTVRSRPNSRFLMATVRGVQQANRAVEVNEMWRIREKQLELDNRLRGARNESSSGRGYNDVSESWRSKSTGHKEVETSESTSLSSRKRYLEEFSPKEDDGLRDDEVDEFLQSRTKRGRGSVGSRMDETTPYPSCPDIGSNIPESSDEEPKKARPLLGPEKPYSLKYGDSSNHESRKDKKKIDSSKQHSKKYKSKEKSKDKKKKRKEDNKRKHHK